MDYKNLFKFLLYKVKRAFRDGLINPHLDIPLQQGQSKGPNPLLYHRLPSSPSMAPRFSAPYPKPRPEGGHILPGLSGGKKSPYLPEEIPLNGTRELGLMIKKLASALSRHKKKKGQGKFLVDVRSSIRASLSSGGKIFKLRWRGRKVRAGRVLLLLDTSASMMPSATLLLQVLHALKEQLPQLEVFIFGTEINRATPYLPLPFEDLLEALRHLPQWNYGGTELRTPLRQLQQEYGHLLNSRTTMLLLSDCLFFEKGLAAPLLQDIRKKVKKAYILNPDPRAKDPSLVYYQNCIESFAQAVDKIWFTEDVEEMVESLRHVLI